ncbi:MAG: HEAT repeat domain-containing protein [Planctomycetota bacterium]
MKTLILGSVIALVLASMEPASASGVLVPRGGRPPIRVRSHRVSAVVEDGLARTTLRQIFVNPYERSLEAVYLFPLPENACLVALAMEVGGQRLEGFLAERRTARRSYDSIVRRGLDPALVEQIGRSAFRLSVFPVVPQQPTVIELEWIESVPLVEGEYRYIYPLALGLEASETEQDLTVTVTMRSSVPIIKVDSPLADMHITQVSPHEARASMERSSAKLAEDIVVVARVATPEPSLAVHVYHPPHGDSYFAAIVTPPMLTDEEVIPRDVTLALDISGSMKGTKFAQAQRAGLWLVEHARAHDRMNLLLFNEGVRAFAEAPVPVTEESRQRLREFLLGATAGGGTALGDVIRRACEAPKESGRAAMAVILTDGLPTVGETAPEKIIAFAREGASRGLKAFTFGVGEDVDSALLQGIATAGGGDVEVFRPHGEIESRLQSFLSRTASAAIADLEVTLGGRRVDDLLPRPLGDIYLGAQAVLTGRVSGTGKQPLVVRGMLKGEPIELCADIDFSRASNDSGTQKAVARDLYARAKLAFLEEALRLRTGLPDQAYYAALDRGRYSTEDELVAALVELSLDTGVQCAYTAFIALLPEDHARLNPRDAQALDEALQRAQRRRNELAGRTQVAGATDDATGTAGDPLAGEPEYRGPGDTVPPNIAGGGDRTPAGNPGGPGAPGGGAGSGRGARTGGFSKRRAGEGFEQWEFWWEYNKEPYLDLRVRLRDRGALPGSGGLVSGPDRHVGHAISNRTTPDDFKNLVLPVLKEALTEEDADVVDSAVLAIARSLPGDEGHLALDEIVKTLAHKQDSAQQSATLALGVLGDERARPILLELMWDTPSARSFLGDIRRMPPMIRGFAALSLGMIGHPDDVWPLIYAINSEPDSERDLKSCALLALGMIRENQEAIIKCLLDVMGEPNMDRLLRSLAPMALANLNTAEARAAGLAPLLEALRSDTTDNDMVRSSVLALGKLATMSDTEVLNSLYAIIANHSDVQARHWAYIALGQIAARDWKHYCANEKAHTQLLQTLLNDLTAPAKRTHQPWAALALAIYLYEYRREDAYADHIFTAIKTLTEAFRNSTNPSYRGAIAIALGLLDAKETAPELLSVLESSQYEVLRGYIAVALGLMGNVEAAPKLRAMIGREGLDWRFRLNLARGLGLMNDVESLDTLLGLLAKATTISEIASLAQAIGLIGDRSALEPLINIVRDTGRPGMVRGFAAVALGLLAEKTPLPWNARISVGLNYRSRTQAIAEILDIL